MDAAIDLMFEIVCRLDPAGLNEILGAIDVDRCHIQVLLTLALGASWCDVPNGTSFVQRAMASLTARGYKDVERTFVGLY